MHYIMHIGPQDDKKQFQYHLEQIRNLIGSRQVILDQHNKEWALRLVDLMEDISQQPLRSTSRPPGW